MVTVSLCMIVKNEEKVLGRCLKSIKEAVDEIVIVDTGSSDRTKEIAAAYTDKIYDHEWKNDFADARNAALAKGTKQYLMWLDADDVMTDAEVRKFQELKERMTGQEDIVMMKYAAGFDEEGNPAFEYYRERLMKNTGKFWFEGAVHEAVTPAGRILYEEITVEHRKEKGGTDPDRNLRIYETMIKEKGQLDARGTFYYGMELFYHGNYEKAASVFTDFLQRGDGWSENKIEACRKCGLCLEQLGRWEEALRMLFGAFAYAAPRGEICCEAGRILSGQKKYEEAVYWYERALTSCPAEEKGGFFQKEYYGYVPCIGLCVCYDRMGNRKLSEEYNDMAGKYKPHGWEFLYNREYFRNQKKKGSVE